MAMNHIDCLCCLGERTAELKLDKKNRPYTKCSACGSTTFMPTSAALRGLVFLVPRAQAILQQVADMPARTLAEAGQRAMDSLQQTGGLGGVEEAENVA